MKKLTNESFKNGWKQALKGVTVEDIINMNPEDLQKLSKSNLSKVVSRVVSATNKRVTAVEKANLPNEIIKESVGKRGVRLSVKGKDVVGLMQEWVSAKKVLSTEKTTVKGTKEYLRKQVVERFAKKGIHIEKIVGTKKEPILWNCLSKLKELHVVPNMMTTNEAIDMIQEIMFVERDPDKILEMLLERVRHYETQKAEYEEYLRNTVFDDLGINN